MSCRTSMESGARDGSIGVKCIDSRAHSAVISTDHFFASCHTVVRGIRESDWKNRVYSQDGASPRFSLRRLPNTKFAGPTSWHRQLVGAANFVFSRRLENLERLAPSRSLRSWETYSTCTVRRADSNFFEITVSKTSLQTLWSYKGGKNNNSS